MSSSRRKRTRRAIQNDSDHDDPPRKRRRSSRVSEKKQEEEEANKNMFGLQVTEIETIAIIHPNQQNIKGSTKIAAFDMDWTLIKPKGTAKFPKGRTDWMWMYKNVPSKLKDLHASGHQIVIFSNQNGIGSGKQSLDSVAGKIIDLSEELEIPLMALLTIQKDHWRKPNVTMWEYFESHYNNSIAIDYSKSFYCGDAAGRPKGWKDKKTKKDFSCSDRKFAANIGLPFHTPDAYFLHEPENKTWKWLSLDPKQWIEQKENNPERLKDKASWFHGTLPIANKDEVEMVLMRGPPGCGKSTFAKKYLVSVGYEWINRDTLKTKKKCLDAVKAALKGKRSVVVDNTNPDSNAREPYIEIAKQFKVKVRLFNMKTEREVAEHMNLVRERMSKGKTKRIPGMVYNIFYKKVRESDPPSLEEGLSEIVDIDFIPDFKDEITKKLWLQFT